MARNTDPATGEGAFPVKYTVLQIEPWTMLDARGNPIPGFKVTFTFEGGVTDSVDIPAKTYQPATVKAAIEDRITLHMGVLILG